MTSDKKGDIVKCDGLWGWRLQLIQNRQGGSKKFGLESEKQDSHVHLGEKECCSKQDKYQGTGELSLVCLRNNWKGSLAGMQRTQERMIMICLYLPKVNTIAVVVFREAEARWSRDFSSFLPTALIWLLSLDLYEQVTLWGALKQKACAFRKLCDHAFCIFINRILSRGNLKHFFFQRKYTEDGYPSWKGSFPWGIFQRSGAWLEQGLPPLFAVHCQASYLLSPMTQLPHLQRGTKYS